MKLADWIGRDGLLFQPAMIVFFWYSVSLFLLGLAAGYALGA